MALELKDGEMLTYKQAAVLVCVPVTAIRTLTRKGKLARTRIGKRVLVRRSELAQLVEECTTRTMAGAQ